MYIDGRHDFAGVLEDLVAWWPKLCQGGLLGGHDWIGNGKAGMALQTWLRSKPVATTAPHRIFITADNPASFFLLKEPTLCT